MYIIHSKLVYKPGSEQLVLYVTSTVNYDKNFKSLHAPAKHGYSSSLQK